MALNTTFSGINPLVKEEPLPDYLKLSHPVSQPEPDKTMGIILKGAGDLLKGSVDATTDLIKTHLSEEIYKRVDAEREPYTEILRKIAPGGGGIRKGGRTGTGLGGEVDADTDVLGYAPISADDPLKALARAPGGEVVPEEEGVPPLLAGQLRYIEGLNNARQGGTISPTFYTGNINSIAKELRGQFPGFRDYIDQEISRVTGFNPANALINNLVRDINSHAGGGGADKQMTAAMKILTDAGKEGLDAFTVDKAGKQLYDTSDVMMAGLLSGKFGANPLPAIMEWQRNLRQAQGRVLRIETENKEIIGGRTSDQMQIMSNLNTEAAISTNLHLNSVFEAAGIKVKDPATMMDIVRRAQRGLPVLDDQGRPVTQEWWLQQGLGMEPLIAKVRGGLRQKYLLDLDENKKTLAAKYGEGGIPAIEKAIEDSLTPLKEIQKAILDKDLGLAYWITKQQDAMLRDMGAAAIMADTPMGKLLQSYHILKAAGAGDMAEKMTWKSLVELPPTADAFLKSVGIGALRNHIPGYTGPTAPAPGVAQPPPTIAPPAPGTPPPAPAPAPGGASIGPGPGRPNYGSFFEQLTTLWGSFDKATTAAKRDPSFSDPKLYTELIDVVKYVNDPQNTDDGKRGLLTYAFNQDGDQRFLSKITKDQYVNGVWTPGRFSTFEKFTTPEIVKEAKRLSGDKWRFSNLVKWTDDNFSGPLLGSELRELEGVMNPNISFTWDPKNREFAAAIAPRATLAGAATTPAEQYSTSIERAAVTRQLAAVQPHIDRLNMAFKGLGNVYDEAGLADQLEKRVVGMLAANNIRGTIGGVEFKVMKAMIEGKVGPELPAEKPAAPPTPRPDLYPPHERAGGKGARIDRTVPSNFTFNPVPSETLGQDYTGRILAGLSNTGTRLNRNILNPGEQMLGMEVE